MSKISDGGDLEIPQIVREYHFRVAQSIINKPNQKQVYWWFK